MNHDLICLFQARALLHMIHHLRVAIRQLCRAALCCCLPCHCRAARLATTMLPALPPPRYLPCHHRTACLATTTLPALPPPHCPPRHRRTAHHAARRAAHHTAHHAATTLPTALPASP